MPKKKTYMYYRSRAATTPKKTIKRNPPTLIVYPTVLKTNYSMGVGAKREANRLRLINKYKNKTINQNKLEDMLFNALMAQLKSKSTFRRKIPLTRSRK